MISNPINPFQSLLIPVGPKKREQNGNKFLKRYLKFFIITASTSKRTG
jgi:hypothetical protein